MMYVCMNYQLVVTILKVLLVSAFNVKKIGFQSIKKVNSHTKPPIVKFHYIITKYMSSSFDGITSDSDPIRQQIATPTIQPNTIIFTVTLRPVTKLGFQLCNSRTTKVTTPATKNKITKKNTAPIPWILGQPALSIVPIAQQNPITDATAHLNNHFSTLYGQLLIYFSFYSHLKAMKQIRQIKLPAGNMRNLKTISCGQWQAVFVMVAWGYGFSCFCEVAICKEYRQAKMSRGMKKQRMQLICIAPYLCYYLVFCGVQASEGEVSWSQ